MLSYAFVHRNLFLNHLTTTSFFRRNIIKLLFNYTFSHRNIVKLFFNYTFLSLEYYYQATCQLLHLSSTEILLPKKLSIHIYRSTDQSARVWGAECGRVVLQYTGHSGSVNSVKFHPTRELVLTASGDYTAHVWQASVSHDHLVSFLSYVCIM